MGHNPNIPNKCLSELGRISYNRTIEESLGFATECRKNGEVCIVKENRFWFGFPIRTHLGKGLHLKILILSSNRINGWGLEYLVFVIHIKLNSTTEWEYYCIYSHTACNSPPRFKISPSKWGPCLKWEANFRPRIEILCPDSGCTVLHQWHHYSGSWVRQLT